MKASLLLLSIALVVSSTLCCSAVTLPASTSPVKLRTRSIFKKTRKQLDHFMGTQVSRRRDDEEFATTIAHPSGTGGDMKTSFQKDTKLLQRTHC